jgi:DNA-binding CsgD family transcriptional regulator/PAS domain-containing protein
MSRPNITSSPAFDEAVLALHACPDLKALFRVAADAAGRLFGAADVRFLLSRGAGLPGLVWRRQDAGIVEIRLDARWLQGPMAATLRAHNEPCSLSLTQGDRDGSRLPHALFPGHSVEAAGALPLHFGRHDLHALLMIGGADLTAALGRPSTALYHRHFRMAFEKLLQAENENSTLLSMRALVGHSCTGLVTLDWDLRPTYANRAAIQYCSSWTQEEETNGWKSGKNRVALPEDIFKECVRLKKTLADQKAEDARPEPATVVQCAGVPGLRASIRLVRVLPTGLRRPFFQVRFERPIGAASRAGQRKNAVADDIRSFLSPSERELLEVAAEGLSNEEIASRLGKSVATVKSQIQSIYRKLSISNRSELIARLSGFSSAKAAR